MSSSSTSDASSSEDEWEEAEIAVNQKITNDDNTNNELQPSPDSVVVDRYSFKPSVARKKQFPDNKKFPYQFWLKSLLQQLTSGYDGNTKESREEKK